MKRLNSPVKSCGSRATLKFIKFDCCTASAKVDVVSIVLWTLLGLAVFAIILAMMICCRKRKEKEDRKTIYTKGSLITNIFIIMLRNFNYGDVKNQASIFTS